MRHFDTTKFVLGLSLGILAVFLVGAVGLAFIKIDRETRSVADKLERTSLLGAWRTVPAVKVTAQSTVLPATLPQVPVKTVVGKSLEVAGEN